MTDPEPPGRFARLFALVDRALQLEGAERSAFLDEECANDPTLRAEVEVLLARERASSRFLEPPDAGFGTPPSGETSGAAGLPHLLGGFEILRELGRGATGVVYLARQHSLKRGVALKVLSTNVTTTPEQIERFHREAQAVARLHHSGIVKVFSDGTAGANHWFAMEYVEGHDLAREIELQRHVSVLPSEQPFLPRPGEGEHATRVARLVADVARALHAAHTAGIVHRDVKPQNLLLQSDGSVRVGDFGLARDAALGTLSATNQLAGTPHYMSPEQARVERTKVDHRTDVYSLGVVLYELCTLRRPYEGKTVVDVFDKIRTAQPRPIRAHNKDIPRDLETICSKAMAKLADLRYRSALEFAEDLERFLSHQAIHARPQTAWDRARRWTRRYRARILTAGAFVAALVVAVVLTDRMAFARRAGVLTLEVRDGSGAAQRGEVFVRAIDGITGVAAERVPVGRLPLRSIKLEPGYYRFEVEVSGFGLRTYTRVVAARENTVIAAVVRRDQSDAQGMVLVPAGTLHLSDPRQPTVAINNRSIPVDSLFVDVCEVTNAKFRDFLTATGHPPPTYWAEIEPQHDALPVTDVTAEDAMAYAEWVGKRLPTIAEWNFIARGAEARLFPWGNDLPRRGVVERGGVANTVETWKDEYFAYAAPVGTSPRAASPEGVHDLYGNAAEWTESPVAELVVRGNQRSFSPLGPTTRWVAGHAWDAGVVPGTADLASPEFNLSGDSTRSLRIGFRCVRDAR